MVKYNNTEYMHGSVKYVFVTRGKSAPFSKEEILSYIAKEEASLAKAPTVEQQLEENLAKVSIGISQAKERQFVPAPFVVPVERTNIFLADLKRGLIFCMNKYGVASYDIVSEAKRIFPSLNLTKLWEKKETSDGVKGQTR